MGKSDSPSRRHQYSSLDVSLTLLSCHYPRKLMKHLREERKIPVAKISEQDTALINRLADDCKLHPKQNIYNKYMHQITIANSKTKGEQIMVCEGILNLYGTSSAEIIERTKKEDAEYYLPQIEQLSSQNTYLKSLLKENNIPFE